MPRKHALTFHAIARSRRHDYHLAGDCSRVRSQSAAQRSREQHERARVVTAFERIVGEYEVFPEAERGVAAAVHERDRALGYDLHAIERVALQEAAAIPAAFQSQPPVFTGDVCCHLLQLRPWRIAAPHFRLIAAIARRRIPTRFRSWGVSTTWLFAAWLSAWLGAPRFLATWLSTGFHTTRFFATRLRVCPPRLLHPNPWIRTRIVTRQNHRLPVSVVWPIRVVRMVRMIRMIRMIGMVGMVGMVPPTASAIIVS